MSKQIVNVEGKIDSLKLKVGELEQCLSDLEMKRRLAILERDTEAKETIRKEHIEVSFEVLQTKDALRELERKRRESENDAISQTKKKEARELQAVRDEVFKRFAPAFKRIEKLQNRLSPV